MELIKNDNEKIRLDKYILDNCTDISRSQIKKAIEGKRVFVNGEIQKSGYLVNKNDIIEFDATIPTMINANPENIPLNIVYEDDDLLVINKPQGMVTHPALGSTNGTLVNALVNYTKDLSNLNGDFRLGIVHRLDKDTTGLLVVAKNNKVHINLQKQIQDKTCHRIYLAILVGKLSETEGVISKNLRRSKKNPMKIETCGDTEGRTAITNYRVLQYLNGYTLVEFQLQTGRTHQIRVHAKYLGHPVLNDNLYGVKNTKISNTGQFLHAYKLVFNSPTTNKQMSFMAPLPQEFRRVLDDLGCNINI